MYFAKPHALPAQAYTQIATYIPWFTQSCLRTMQDRQDSRWGNVVLRTGLAMHEDHAQPCKTKLDIYSREHTSRTYIASCFGCVAYPTVVPECEMAARQSGKA